MNKNYFIQQIAEKNAILTDLHIPFQFEANFSQSHPALLLKSSQGKRQLRKGNYEQVCAKLTSEMLNILEAFTNRPAMVRMTTITETIEKQYTARKPIAEHCQSVVNTVGTTALIAVNKKYFFILTSKY